MAASSLQELKEQYPYVHSNMAETLFSIQANHAQWGKSNNNAKEGIDKLLKENYGQTYEFPQEQFQKGDCSVEAPSMERIVIVTGTTGAGKSATANNLLGGKWFDESSSATSKTTSESGTCKDKKTLVVDTPGSWETPASMHREPVPVFYVFVINIACPRFTDHDLELVKNIQYPNEGTVLTSGRCVAVLTHADSALQKMTLDMYLSEIEGDLLHTFLTEDMDGRFLAVNNSADTSYEREQNQRAILSRILKLQRSTEATDIPQEMDPPRVGGVQNVPKNKSAIIAAQGTPDRKENLEVKDVTQEGGPPSGTNKDKVHSAKGKVTVTEDAANKTLGPPVADSKKPTVDLYSIQQANGRSDTALGQEQMSKSRREEPLRDLVKHGGPPHITNRPQHFQSEPNISKTLQIDPDIARDTHIAPVQQRTDHFGGFSTGTVPKEKSISKSTPATLGGKDDPPVVDCEKAMAVINIAHKANGQPENALCKSRTVTSPEQQKDISRGLRNIKSTVTAIARTDIPEEETQWKAHQESKDKLKKTMDNGKKTISNAVSPDEKTRVAEKDMERHQITGPQCKTSDLERECVSDSTCEDTDISSRVPLGKTVEEAHVHTTHDTERSQYPEGPVSQRYEAELGYIQRPNCCLFHGKTLLSMKIKEHEQTMENLLLKKKNLTLKHELLKIRLEKERRNQDTDKAKFHFV